MISGIALTCHMALIALMRVRIPTIVCSHAFGVCVGSRAHSQGAGIFGAAFESSHPGNDVGICCWVQPSFAWNSALVARKASL